MRELLKLILCEFRKLKRKKLFSIAFLTTFIMPLLYSFLLKNEDFDDLISVVTEENGFLLLIPLTVVTAANLFFEEHDHDTLKNLMCIPVSKSRLAAAKLLVLLLFDIAYELAGFGTAVFLSFLSGIPAARLGLQLYLVFCDGILLWAAATPCILLVVWCNRSYIISVVIAFAYTVMGYILHISDTVLRVPLGLNIATALPVPMIFRWLYQFHSVGEGEVALQNFYEELSPYFVPTPVVFAILLTEGMVCTALLMRVYQKQTI